MTRVVLQVVGLLIRVAFLSGSTPHAGGVIALLGRLLPLAFDAVALIVSQLTLLTHEIACVAGLVALVAGPIAFAAGVVALFTCLVAVLRVRPHAPITTDVLALPLAQRALPSDRDAPVHKRLQRSVGREFGSVLGNGNFADGRDGARTPGEAGPQEPLEGLDVIGFDDIEEDVLGVRSVAPDQSETVHGGVVQRVGAALVPWTVLRTVDLRDMEEHRTSS